MKAKYFSENWSDENQNPAGGTSSGTGFCISWQNGPLGRDGARTEPNGAFVETILNVVRRRLEFYQMSKFHCIENEEAIKSITEALGFLNLRTKSREDRKVEGTHET